MKGKRHAAAKRHSPGSPNDRTGNLTPVIHDVVELTKQQLSRIDFKRSLLKRLLAESGCEAVELWLPDGDNWFVSEATVYSKRAFEFRMVARSDIKSGREWSLDRLCAHVIGTEKPFRAAFSTTSGSVWIDDASAPLPLRKSERDPLREKILVDLKDYLSLAIIPLLYGNDVIGCLALKSESRRNFSRNLVSGFEDSLRPLGMLLETQHVSAALRERVKELTCLYGIEQLAQRTDLTIPEVLRRIASLLPPSWQYPDIASARIALGRDQYTTSGFKESDIRQRADIIIKGTRRGFVEVAYAEIRPDIGEGPFLFEERKLINGVAAHIAFIIEQRKTIDDQRKLHEQLRHADRLATIGQLAAGVAHEINEPLVNILGFSQLAQKCPKLPEQAGQDLGKIISASLFAREVIKKLLIFARQAQTKKERIKINEVVKEGMYFLESRCAKEGVTLRLHLGEDLPEVEGDMGQLQQVLVNLVVNAIQSMPSGGTLTVHTSGKDGQVCLSVEDTGEGMSEETQKQVLMPFFTTKEIGSGTGLGLSVSHGIITAHEGKILVESKLGVGSRFDVCLPAKSLSHTEEVP